MEDGRVDVYENACARLALERVRFERVYNVTGREVRAPPPVRVKTDTRINRRAKRNERKINKTADGRFSFRLFTRLPCR